MTPDRTDPMHSDDAEHEQNGVLSESGSIDTSGFGFLGGHTEQVSVQLPSDSGEDDIDDDVVDDEVPYPTAELTETGDRNTSEHTPDFAEDVALTGELEEMPVDASIYASRSIEDGAVIEDAVVEDSAIGDAAPEDAALGDAAFEDAAHEHDAPGEERSRVEDVAVEDASLGAGTIAHGDTPDAEDVGVVDEPPLAQVAPVAKEASVAPTIPVAATATGSLSVANSTLTTGSVPATRRAAQHPQVHERPDQAHAVERVIPRTDVAMTSKRLGEFEAGRETADLLTADRLLDPHQVVRPEPEGVWQHLLYSISGHRINLGDGKRARARKELDRRIAAPLNGGARFVPVLSRKGGVGKTTVTTLLGMALADARDDRIIAVDANPDRGTLAERISHSSGKTVRDLVKVRSEVSGYNDISNIVARDGTRLDVLASDADPHVSEALNDRDYHDVASLAAHYYSIVLTDTGTGIVHSVMGATLDLADQIIVVAGLSVDEARLASETLTWLETNGYGEHVRNAIVVLNTARPGTPLVQLGELEGHFRTRVRAVVRIPYDPHVAAGSAIAFRDLQPATRLAARELAATLVEGLRALSPAA